jgi:glycine/D-amino acid oxidase-like deaminating enzyme
MKRDGAMQSLWQVGMDVYNAKNISLPTGVVDVVIVGGGITGVTTALLLQKSGLQCVVAEAHNLCFGTTGGTTAHLNTFFDTSYNEVIKDFGELDAQLMAASARQALNLFKHNVAEYKSNQTGDLEKSALKEVIGFFSCP